MRANSLIHTVAQDAYTDRKTFDDLRAFAVPAYEFVLLIYVPSAMVPSVGDEISTNDGFQAIRDPFPIEVVAVLLDRPIRGIGAEHEARVNLVVARMKVPELREMAAASVMRVGPRS